MIGKILGNRYEIIEQLGGGGMALVYKAKCTLLNRVVTVKILRPEFTSDDEFVERFRREAQSVAKLSHPNIVSVYDVGEEDGIYYIIMEYIDGRTLKDIIREKGKLPVNEAVDIAEQICRGIGHAHENGIVHRDIKPHNILLTKTGLVKVTDFGIARAVTAATVTQSNTIIGSVHYFSPEQAKGEDSGARSDIYSTGVVLYEMLTGRLPFDGETPIAIAIKQIQEKPVPPSKIVPDISPELERVVLRAMEKDPDFRYQAANEMAKDLGTVLEGRISEGTRVMALDEFATKVLPAEALARELGKTVPEQTQPAKKKKMKPAAKAAIIGAVVLLLILAAIGIRNYIYVPDVTVPNVSNMTLADAKSLLKDRGLDARVAGQQYSADVIKDRVLSTSPKSGSKVKKGRVINLTMSKGIETVDIPDVRKKTFTDAQYELDKVGLKVQRIDEYNDTLPQDSVIDQDPGPDETAPTGSTVTLRVSKGPQKPVVQVPDLTNMSLDDARNALSQAGFTLDNNISHQASNNVMANHVISQDPAPNTLLQQGQSVKVTVSDGPGPAQQSATITLQAKDPQPQVYVIKIRDARGITQVYQNTLVGGQKEQVTVTYYGNNATYEVWMNGQRLPNYPQPITP